MKRKLGLFAALLTVIVAGLVASGSASALPVIPNPLLCVDRGVQVTFDQYGYYDGRTAGQLEYIVQYGDPNGAVVNGVWVQQLPPGVFADYVGPNPYAPGAYSFHSVKVGFCGPPRIYILSHL